MRAGERAERPFVRGLIQGAGVWVALAALSATSLLIAAPLGGTWKIFSDGETLTADDLNNNFGLLKVAAEAANAVPVGTIVAWHKSLGGTPSLPSGWLECNGQTVSDVGSPFNGLVLPNLNGERRFLRGGATSGTLEADAFQNHNHYRSPSNLDEIALTQGPRQASFIANIITGSQDVLQTYTGNAASGNTSSETRPINMAVVWIIRVK